MDHRGTAGHELPALRVPRASRQGKQSLAEQAEECRLIAAARADPQDFAPLYRRYATPLYRYLYQQLGDPHEAEDLTSSTFGKALASLDRYREQGSFAAWLFSIARHTL